MELVSKLYTAEEVRALDGAAMEAGIPGMVLMERAGEGAVQAMARRWELSGGLRVGVLTGGGNNGGDGYVVARRLRELGVSAEVVAVGDPDRLKGDAAEAAARWRAADGAIRPGDTALDGYDLLVDALLGTGLSSEVRSPFREAVHGLNRAPAPVVALDIPSGLDADTGRIQGVAVSAVLTVTFVGRKRGLYTGDGPDRSGEVHFEDLGIPAAVRASQPASGELLGADALRFPPRAANSHKGRFGRVVVVGGAPGMSGAAALAGWGALRSGAGWVVCCVAPEAQPQVAGFRPELLTEAWAGNQSPEALANADALAVGPGLGRAAPAADLLAACLESPAPVVLDADGLNGVADSASLAEALKARAAATVLTPHPGEAARLLGIGPEDVQADRFAAAREIAERFRAVCCLKGAGSVVAWPDGEYAVNPTGNAGMSMGGQGDILTGILAAQLAGGTSPEQAAHRAVWAHGTAGDRVAAARGPFGYTPTECADALPGVWQELVRDPL
jgi:NAD(P)H-hydrate epimerase